MKNFSKGQFVLNHRGGGFGSWAQGAMPAIILKDLGDGDYEIYNFQGTPSQETRPSTALSEMPANRLAEAKELAAALKAKLAQWPKPAEWESRYAIWEMVNKQ